MTNKKQTQYEKESIQGNVAFVIIAIIIIFILISDNL
jgi:hypothetical protein